MKYYLKDRHKTILFIGAIISIFFFITYLYYLPLEGFIYALCLVSILVLFVGVYDYSCYMKKLKTYQRYLSLDEFSELPQELFTSIMDEEILQLINHYRKRCFELKEEMLDIKKADEDYYMLWAHQIKLPIASMKLHLESSSSINKQLLKSELVRMGQYTDHVLAYIRLNSTSSDYLFTKVEIDSLILYAIRLFSSDFISKRIKIDFEKTNCVVLTDEKWFLFIIEQILSNALKYSSQGTIHIYLKNDYLYIEDEGIGISEASLKRVFEKGYTGENGHQERNSSGLGLYLVDQISKQLDLPISIESEVNKGTKVKIDLRKKELEIF